MHRTQAIYVEAGFRRGCDSEHLSLRKTKSP